MPTAYILINTETGLEFDVARELRRIEGVKEVSPVYGAYDIVVKVSSENAEDLKRIVTWQIRKLSSIKATLTNIIHEKTEQPAPSQGI
ncbi:MAG: Lrp/AsnC ligand binding domain-containing protein [Candidatus Bathyarchaeota archaeon]|nr:Lrp/AsnC ligand binding domain-containing protein [Candidatus Bathyarchaeota archaeon]